MGRGLSGARVDILSGVSCGEYIGWNRRTYDMWMAFECGEGPANGGGFCEGLEIADKGSGSGKGPEKRHRGGCEKGKVGWISN